MVLSIVNLTIVGGIGTSLDHTFCQPRNWSTHSTSLSEALPDSSHKHSSSALVSRRDPTKAQRVYIPKEATTLTWLSHIHKDYISDKSTHEHNSTAFTSCTTWILVPPLLRCIAEFYKYSFKNSDAVVLTYWREDLGISSIETAVIEASKMWKQECIHRLGQSECGANHPTLSRCFKATKLAYIFLATDLTVLLHLLASLRMLSDLVRSVCWILMA